ITAKAGRSRARSSCSGCKIASPPPPKLCFQFYPFLDPQHGRQHECGAVRGDEVRIYLPATEVLPLRKTWKKFAESTFPPLLISLLSTAHTAMRLRGSSGSPSMPIH